MPGQEQKLFRAQVFAAPVRIDAERDQRVAFIAVSRQSFHGIAKSFAPGPEDGIRYGAQFPPGNLQTIFHRPEGHRYHCRVDLGRRPEGRRRHNSFQAGLGGKGGANGEGAISAAGKCPANPILDKGEKILFWAERGIVVLVDLPRPSA